MKSAKKLVEVLCRITEPAIMRRFFSEIFTPAEIDDFVLQWRLMEMLTSDLASKISGRYIEIRIYPLDLEEFIKFRGDAAGSPEEGFVSYLKFGGMPGLGIGRASTAGFSTGLGALDQRA